MAHHDRQVRSHCCGQLGGALQPVSPPQVSMPRQCRGECLLHVLLAPNNIVLLLLFLTLHQVCAHIRSFKYVLRRLQLLMRA